MVEKPDTRCTAVYPTLPVTNVKETIEYYQSQLGFELRFEYGEPPTHAAVSLGEATVHFFTSEPRPDGHWIYFDIDNIEKLYQWLSQNNVELLDHPAVQPWGMKEFNIRDLNGYTLRFGEFARK